MVAAKGSTVHLDLSTPTTSMCATRRRARDGSGMAALRRRATSALRPGARSRNSEVIPSFVRMAATYFAAACSLPGGFVVSMRMRSASQPSASLARAVVSPAGERVFSTVGMAVEGTCAVEGGATMGDNHASRTTAGTKMCILRFQFTKTSSVLDAAHGDRLSNALQLTRFILTCRCGAKSEGLAGRCVSSNGARACPVRDNEEA